MTDPATRKFKLKNIYEAHAMSRRLAAYFPKPDQCMTGIYELLLNAVEHGNLDIGFEAKTALIRQGKWREEIARRRALPQYAGREVSITLTIDENRCRLAIADQGKGFVWRDYAEIAARTRRPNGRGLWIAFNSKFDSITFNETGNEVTCVMDIPNKSDDTGKKGAGHTP